MSATEQDLEQLTGLFRLLSDRTRLTILLLLAGGERNVSSLCEQLKLPQPTVSHHLGLLRMSNIIGNRRSGKNVFYSLNGCMDQADPGVLRVLLKSHCVSVAPRSPGDEETTATHLTAEKAAHC